MKYIIYTRKSSEDEDRQALSIESQIRELKEIAEKRNLKIVDILEESKSAKQPGRPVFNRLINNIQQGKANGIICWKLDRLARNPVDGGQISWLLQQGVIQSIQTFEKEYLPSDNVLMMSVELGMANQFIRDLSTGVKRGLKTKLEQGWYPEIAPIGYLNDKTKERGERTIIKDPERFDMVRKMWDLMLTGIYTPPKVLDIANNEWGLRTVIRKKIGGVALSRSSIYKIFTNPFYYGWFSYKGQMYKGSHEAMISEHEYWQVQKILGKKGQARPHTHQFAFTGMIRCGECNAMITAETKHKTQLNGTQHEYTYYHCTKRKPGIKCEQGSIRLEDLEKQIDEYLSKLYIPKDFIKLALDYLKKENKSESNKKEQIFKNLQSAYNSAQKQMSSLIDMRVRELISDEEYLERKEKIQLEINRLKEKIDQADQRSEEWLELCEKTFSFAYRARYWFNHGSMQDKKMILQTIGSNLVLKNKKLYIEPVKPFAYLLNRSKKSNWLRSSGSNREPTG